MAKTLFFTGYPGFLARHLIQQMIKDDYQEIEHIYLLVLPQMDSEARAALKQSNIDRSKFTILHGDITKPDLGIAADFNQQLVSDVTHIFHLAAIYDLAVPYPVAYDVNVNGTNHVNQWAKSLQNLERYTYFSTAYVSGWREGKIYEHELREGQTFKNYYESTKYEAEVLVDALKTELPITIIRPGVVKGHSETGQTIKFDGLYFMLNYLENSRYLPMNFYFGKNNPEGNFVPSDYILEATSYLAMHPVGEGKTYHLTDPHPKTMHELQALLSVAYLGRKPQGVLPIPMAKIFLSSQRARQLLHVEKEMLDYCVVRSSYDASQATKDLSEAGIACPDITETIPSMINFYRKYKDDYKKHLVIK